MKYFLALLTVILITVIYLFFNSDAQRSDKQHSNEALTGLPWQIDILPGGYTRVFDITLGKTTLGEAVRKLGDDDMGLAIIAAPGETGALEAYYSRYSAGPITGKLILVLDITPDVLTSMRERAFQDGGTRRYRLHPDDLPAAYLAPVRIINFMPSFNLDEKIALARFGSPAEVIRLNEKQQHYLYPDKGLDLILSVDGKEILQYLSPDRFSIYRARLQQLPPGSE